jgi:hypothetical protein
MGQAKARGTREQRVAEAIGRNMANASRRVEATERLKARSAAIAHSIRTGADLPPDVLERLQKAMPQDVTIVGSGIYAPAVDLKDGQLHYSPEAAADGWLAVEKVETPTLPAGEK